MKGVVKCHQQTTRTIIIYTLQLYNSTHTDASNQIINIIQWLNKVADPKSILGWETGD
jgi:hypothetical protein